jgi:hypothetical protein
MPLSPMGVKTVSRAAPDRSPGFRPLVARGNKPSSWPMADLGSKIVRVRGCYSIHRILETFSV